MTDGSRSLQKGVLVSRQVFDNCGDRILEIGKARGCALRLHVLPGPGMPALSQDTIDQIHAAFYSRDVWQGSTMANQSEATAAFFKLVDAARQLEWLHVTSAGIDLAQFPQYRKSTERELLLSTSSGSNASPIAQTVVAAVLAHARGFLHWMQGQRECRWSPLGGQDLPRDLEEQSVVIVGMGAIGIEIGRLLKAVGMRTVGIRRNVGPADHFDAVHHYSDLDALLPEASFVVLACPLTDETRHILNAEKLARLPPSATLINVGRGELVDEAALVDALSCGRLRSAYLDVFEVEPLPAESPLWRMQNVWISPHNSSAAEGNARRVTEIFLANMDRWLRGERLVNEAKAPSA